MRIAQVAPLFESVPPKFYGGTERIVSYLTEELVRQGHEVTLFASGDSSTSGTLSAVVPRALRLDHGLADPLAPHIVQMSGNSVAPTGKSTFRRRRAHQDDLVAMATSPVPQIERLNQEILHPRPR